MRTGTPSCLALVLALAAALTGPALAADAAASDWTSGSKWQARLVAASDRLAGFEIKLAPGAITYWRDPGDAGLPPSFDFAASENVASVEPAFPAPKRMHEADGGEAFGYEGGVIFPLHITPRDPAKPVTLALDVHFAVCEKVCLPAAARLTLTLPAEAASSPEASAIDAAAAVVARRRPEGLRRAFARRRRYMAALRGPRSGRPAHLFVEPPTGWWMTAAPASAEGGRDCFTIALRDKPNDAALPVPLRLTLTGGPARSRRRWTRRG